MEICETFNMKSLPNKPCTCTVATHSYYVNMQSWFIINNHDFNELFCTVQVLNLVSEILYNN